MFPPTWSTSEWVTGTFIVQTITSALQSVLYFTGTTNRIHPIQDMQAYALHTEQQTVSNAKVINILCIFFIAPCKTSVSKLHLYLYRNNNTYMYFLKSGKSSRCFLANVSYAFVFFVQQWLWSTSQFIHNVHIGAGRLTWTNDIIIIIIRLLLLLDLLYILKWCFLDVLDSLSVQCLFVVFRQ